MKNLATKLRNEKGILLKIFVIVMLYFGINVYFAFATDSYGPLNDGFRSRAIEMVIYNGRPIIGLMYGLHYLSGLPNASFYYISTVLALLFLITSIWLYQKILAKHGLGDNIRILVSFIAIANIFIIEYFMFIEKCGFMLAILFDIVAVYFIEKFFEKKGGGKEILRCSINSNAFGYIYLSGNDCIICHIECSVCL